MRPTKQEIVTAVSTFGILRFFPTSENDRREIMRFIERLVSTKRQLDWLVETVINHCNDWPGPKEVRGILCTRFKPADGIEADCTIAGFTADDGERRSIEKSTAELSLPSGQRLIEEFVSSEELQASEDSRRSTISLARDGVKSLKPSPVKTPEWLDRAEGVR